MDLHDVLGDETLGSPTGENEAAEEDAALVAEAAEGDQQPSAQEKPEKRVGEKAEQRIARLIAERDEARTRATAAEAKLQSVEERDREALTREGKLKELEPWSDAVREVSRYARTPEEWRHVQKMLNHPDPDQRWDDRDLEIQELKISLAREKEAKADSDKRAAATAEEREIDAEVARMERAIEAVAKDYPFIPDEMMESFLERHPKAEEAELREYVKAQVAKLEKQFGTKRPAAAGARSMRAGASTATGSHAERAKGPIDSKEAKAGRIASLRDSLAALGGMPGD